MRKITVLIALFFSLQANAAYLGFGGFSAFPFSTQTDVDGSASILAVDPVLTLGGVLGEFWGHKFVPEIGYSMSLGEVDGYDKSTFYILFDLANNIGGDFLLRYGIGWFNTSVGGDGAMITINNGSGYATAYRPGESTTSYNVTLNLGAETRLNSDATMRLEGYLFEFLDSEKLDFSYTLTINYFLKGF